MTDDDAAVTDDVAVSDDEAAGTEPARRRRTGTALCLSGGGYRAAIFHLGALRRLHEVGLLAEVDTISSVSGGSIIAGFLADAVARGRAAGGLAFADWEGEVAVPFRRFVGGDIRTAPLLAHALWNWRVPQRRVGHLERLYRAQLTGIRLREMPERPSFVLCAADLTFGVNWIFTRAKVGDYQVGYSATAADWPLARAVAASSCFPPVFGPMTVRADGDGFRSGRYRAADRAELLRGVHLTDGGVYDNLGLEPVWRNHARVLVSDGGAPFDYAASPPGLGRLLRYSAVVTNQARALRKRMLFADLEEGRYEGAYWAVSGGVGGPATAGGPFAGYPKDLVGAYIARVRTDLDGFSDGEIAVLENHGYFEAERALARRLPGAVASGPAPVAPHPALLRREAVEAALRESHKRFSPSRTVDRVGAAARRGVAGIAGRFRP